MQNIPLSRREWLNNFGLGLGGIAFAELMNTESHGAPTSPNPQPSTLNPQPSGVLKRLHHKPTAKRGIFLFQAGGPSQMDLFDYKPVLNKLHGTQLPEEIRKGQRLTGMSAGQASLPLVGSPFQFRRHGRSGAWLSDLLPHTAKIADELCFVKSMHTEAINHGPAVTHVQTGSQFPGRPSIGGWLSYGLGSANANLPAFVVLVTKNKGGQPLVSRFWGSGFLPSKHQGVRFRSGKDPVLYLRNPAGIDAAGKRRMLDTLRKLHQLERERTGDAALDNRIAQDELAFRMQMSIPEVTDLSKEPKHVVAAYGRDASNPGTFAANCLLARRLAERGVRFIQLYHQGWDQHGGLPTALPRQCRETDQPAAALVADLKRRGLLDDTLVIWGGEFGRTNYCQGKLQKNFGRDHHPRCFTYWFAGGGIKPGVTYGETDPFCYNIAKDPVHIHDLQATLLHTLGIDHERLTFKYQGRRFRLTDVHGEVVKAILV
ncbi:MAG: DUF1501 domain-containing protein [Planctomycetaceae bacterium]